VYRYKNVLACLNLSHVDPTVIRYAGLLARTAGSDRVSFVHVVSPSSLPESFLEEYPQFAPQVDDMMRERLEEEVAQYFSDQQAPPHVIEILQGDKLRTLVGRIHDDDVDLVILGRKREQSGRDSLEKLLTRKAPCSVLIVPEGAEPAITRILCPVDFSPFAQRAMEKALLYCRTLGLRSLTAAHYYDLPSGYSKLGLSAEEFARQLEPHLARQFDEFLARMDTSGVTVERILRRAGDVPRAVQEDVAVSGADLIVLGSRGRSASASVFLGTMAEKLIWTTQTPMLVAKEKGEGAGLLRLIFEGS